MTNGKLWCKKYYVTYDYYYYLLLVMASTDGIITSTILSQFLFFFSHSRRDRCAWCIVTSPMWLTSDRVVFSFSFVLLEFGLPVARSPSFEMSPRWMAWVFVMWIAKHRQFLWIRWESVLESTLSIHYYKLLLLNEPSRLNIFGHLLCVCMWVLPHVFVHSTSH